MNKILYATIVATSFASCSLKENQTEPSEQSSTAHEAEHLHLHEKDPAHYYTCSMHPKIKQSEPGKCPICMMTLTKVEVDEDDQGSSPEAPVENLSPGDAIAKVKLRKSQLSHFKPSYFPVTTMKMTKNVRLLGSVLQSEDKESTIPARIGGRVEKVYIKSTGSFVQRGDPVLQLYSPKLITAGEEYLVSRKSYENNRSPDFKQLVVKTQERLELWGIRKSQYEAWYRRGKVPDRIVIYSPSTGIVRKHNAKVGKYFKEGQNFFELSDLSEVWVEMDVYEHDSAIVKMGQEVALEFSSSPGETVHGTIDFINPVLDPKSRTLKIRTTIANKDGTLKPGMIAEASLTIIFAGEPIVVPRTAIINTGKRKVVWVKITDKQFEAKVVHTGFESEGYVEVRHGLMAEEQVVMDGNFLLDAQAQLFGGYSDMTPSSEHSHQH